MCRSLVLFLGVIAMCRRGSGSYSFHLSITGPQDGRRLICRSQIYRTALWRGLQRISLCLLILRREFRGSRRRAGHDHATDWIWRKARPSCSQPVPRQRIEGWYAFQDEMRPPGHDSCLAINGRRAGRGLLDEFIPIALGPVSRGVAGDSSSVRSGLSERIRHRSPRVSNCIRPQ